MFYKISWSILRYNKIRLFIFAVLCCLCLIFTKLQNSNQNVNLISDTDEHQLILQRVNTTKYVLFYTPFFEINYWNLGQETIDEQYFINHKCPVTSCTFTRNSALLPEVELFDALIFHVVGPQQFNWPKFRRGHQQYIAAGIESPIHFHRHIKYDNGIINWIMNYRLDSDILWVYGTFHDIKTGKQIAPSPHPRWIKPNPHFTDEKYLQLTQKKTKLALWMVSNCETDSKRELLVHGIRKHMKVDIYGKCADQNGAFKLKCPRRNALDTDSCNQMMEDDFKFYFAFENSLCEDYVTEKLFRTMSLLIVPVVYGGANYTRFAPPHSYIDANNYRNAESLAKYLLYLNDNPLEYIKYFWWKKHYTVQPNDVSTYCDICKKVTVEAENLPLKTYNSIQDWWFVGCKIKPTIQFNNSS